ncbi:hypothetical protein RCO27_10960 [Sphingosinicella sp. LHD-64]|uniref:hypothetical protein n=1 Tax=Sphingosinicella sp. LHD-64 TaxID=3072139 RepID=UPI00280E507D|nr:hypothetical protein [Sphingosinicella sp. LHD-64]MDQ8756748.1 hypothetical protein [Sphingosinicella sp. LHD-64]
MDKAYWIGRKRAALAMARGAATSEARLAHYDRAGRCAIAAAQCRPFLMVENGSVVEAKEGPRDKPPSKPARPGSIFRGPWAPPPQGRDQAVREGA